MMRMTTKSPANCAMGKESLITSATLAVGQVAGRDRFIVRFVTVGGTRK
jgi:hypothetical protein